MNLENKKKEDSEVKDCRDCPHRCSVRGHGECWEQCNHREIKDFPRFNNHLWGCGDKFVKIPDWCPIKIGDHQKLEEGDYIRYKKIFKEMIRMILSELNKTNANLIDFQISYGDAQRSHASGLKNVYDKFLELEKRQIEIEHLLKSDRLIEIINKIPTEQCIKDMLFKVENADVAKLIKHINKMRESFQDLVDRLTW